MRLGCLGCLGSLLSLVAVLALVAGGAWTWTRAWEPPPPLPAVPAVHPKSAGLDRKLAELDRRGKRQTGRPESITFSESEVSAIASQFLADAGLLTASLTTEMHEGRAVVQWQGPVGMLLQGPPLGWAAPMLTGGMMQSPVWITLTGAVQLQPVPAPGRTRYAEVSVERARIGRLPVPGWLLTAMAGPRGASLLRWAVPATVDRLDLGEGRLTIRTR